MKSCKKPPSASVTTVQVVLFVFVHGRVEPLTDLVHVLICKYFRATNHRSSYDVQGCACQTTFASPSPVFETSSSLNPPKTRQKFKFNFLLPDNSQLLPPFFITTCLAMSVSWTSYIRSISVIGFCLSGNSGVLIFQVIDPNIVWFIFFY